MDESPVSRFTPVDDPRPSDEPWPSMVWPIPTGTVLRGRWVELARLDPAADAEALFRALDDAAVWRHLNRRADDAAGYRRALAHRAADPTQHLWTVRAAADGTVIGTTSYLEVAPADARLEIGWTAYRRSAWGSAVNPETKLLLLRYAFATLRVGRVQLKTDVRNARSQQAIARLGATFEGVLRRYQRRADGSVRDSVLFSITAEQWPEVERGLALRLAASAGPAPDAEPAGDPSSLSDDS